jgi:hypothetical protein
MSPTDAAVAHHTVRVAAHHYTDSSSRFTARSQLSTRAEDDGGPSELRVRQLRPSASVETVCRLAHRRARP